MSSFPNVLGGAWDFTLAHPFIAAWIAVTSAWMLFTIARRES